MESEAKIQAFLLLGKNLKGRSCAEFIAKATSEPGLYNFGELWDLPGVQDLKDGEFANHIALLELFCYGTWSDYKAHQASLPQLNASQQTKLKQLTLVQLATTQRVLAYAAIQHQLDIPADIRQLEDFIITECFYTGLIRGKLDQAEGALIVHDVHPRDVRRERLPQLAAALDTWLSTARGVLGALEGAMEWQAAAGEAADKRRADLEAAVEEARKGLKNDIEARMHDAGPWMGEEGGLLGGGLDEDDFPAALAGVGPGGRERKPSAMLRPKRRR